MAKMVGPGGKVIAVDIQPRMLRMLRDRAQAEGVENIETVLGESDDPKLPPDTCDRLLLVDVYHEIAAPEAMLRHMHRAIKPDGTVVLVEYRAEDDSVPIRPLHKMSKEQILKEFLPIGFELVREYDGLPWQHLMFFARAKD
jgi:ubiquinone/menaquinone biosynthesis C-methylase UbiE